VGYPLDQQCEGLPHAPHDRPKFQWKKRIGTYELCRAAEWRYQTAASSMDQHHVKRTPRSIASWIECTHPIGVPPSLHRPRKRITCMIPGHTAGPPCTPSYSLHPGMAQTQHHQARGNKGGRGRALTGGVSGSSSPALSGQYSSLDDSAMVEGHVSPKSSCGPPSGQAK
jgi:hypothetical protein